MMSKRRIQGATGTVGALAVGLLLIGTSGATAAGDAPPAPAVVATVAEDTPPLLRRSTPAAEWKLVHPKQEVRSGETLLGVPNATLVSRNGAVRLDLRANLSRNAPDPVIESAVVLNVPDKVDLDLTLDRGMIVLTNLKKEGSAKVNVRFRQTVWALTLSDPNSQMMLALFGRWPRGVRFHREPKPGDVPTSDLRLIVRKGSAQVRVGAVEYGLSEPPGAASFHWESVAGPDPAPTRVAKLPEWADPAAEDTPLAKESRKVARDFRMQIAKKPVGEALREALASDQPGVRDRAVIAMGATDDLPGLIDALADPKRPDVREAAVRAARHWIGRAPGQDQKLYQALITERKYKPTEAALVLQGLHSFGDDDLKAPSTYEALVAYLEHEKVAIRELAYWHLTKLTKPAPEQRFDAGAPAAEREKAVAAWKKWLAEREKK